MNNKLRIIIAFLIGVLTAGLLGTVFQTQVNLAAISEVGPPITFAMRITTTWYDLIAFAPLYLAIVLVTFLVAILIAELIAAKLPGHRLLWLTLACVLGLWATFNLIDAAAPMPTFIAATRGTGGTLLMLLAAAIGAIVYSFLSSHLDAPEDRSALQQESEE